MRIAADGAHLFVRAAGEGETVIAIHGGPDFDHAYLMPELDMLAQRCRLVCYDQRGRGRSSGADDATHVTIESEVADLDAVRAWAGGQVTLLGHSWGALLALEYATRLPHHVARLVLISPAPISAKGARVTRDFIAARRSEEDLRRLAALRADPAWQAGQLEAEAEYYRAHFRVALEREADVEQLVGRLRRHFRPADVLRARSIEDRLYELTWSRPDYDLLPLLPGLRIPTLVVHGERDLIPLTIAEQIAQALPNAELAVIPDAGHFAYLEQPRAFAAIVFGFLERTRQHPSSATRQA